MYASNLRAAVHHAIQQLRRNVELEGTDAINATALALIEDFASLLADELQYCDTNPEDE